MSYLLQSRSQGSLRGNRRGGNAGWLRNRPEWEQCRRRLRLGRRLLATQPTFAEQLLNPADRVALLIEVLPDPPEQVDVLWAVVTAATPALERFDLWEFGFPEPQHVCWQIELLCDFTGGSKRSARFAGAPGGCDLVRLGHLSPMKPWRSPHWSRSKPPERD